MGGGRPSVVFVVLDTVRKDHLTVYGYDRPTSPELERFADEATVFEQAVTPAPWTLPVHASLFTGLYPSEHGASQEQPYLDSEATLASALSASGYATACYSSNAWITPYTGLTAGFDDHDNFFEIMPGEFLSKPLARAWRGLNDNDVLRSVADRLVAMGNRAHEFLAGGDRADSKTPQAVDQAIDFATSHEPSFVFLNLLDAHLPYYPPDEYKEMFAPDVDPSTVCQNSKEYNAGARSIDEEEWEAIRGLYDAEVRHVDAQVGRLFDRLRESGLWDETLIIVCADHGELHGEHGLYGHEFNLYEPVINVPLMVKHPDLQAGRRTEQVELLDLYHTVLDHAGVDQEHADGVPCDQRRSLLSPGERAGEEAEYAFVEYARPVVELTQLESKADAAGVDLDEDSRFYSQMRAVRRIDAKYIRNERLPDELYRLDTDPDETNDRYGTGDAVEDELREALSAFETRVGATWDGEGDTGGGVDDMDHQAKDRLRQLGYLE